MKVPTVFFLMGPTGSGKTELTLALADEFPISIIQVDSAQIYRGLDIGSAKVSRSIQEKYPHALIDIADPAQAYSAADFCRDARVEIEKALASGKVPFLSGGTMMYFKALQFGLSPLPGTDPDIRAAIAREAEVHGWPALHESLMQVDPITAQRLKPQDAQRISRAWEVFRMTGKPLSTLQVPAAPLPYGVKAIGLMPGNRILLHEQLAKRFDAMLAEGFLEEVKSLRKRSDLHSGLPALKAVGYAQAWQYLDGQLSFELFRETAIAATRQLAKRQMTWLRQWPHIEHLDPQKSGSLEHLRIHLENLKI